MSWKQEPRIEGGQFIDKDGVSKTLPKWMEGLEAAAIQRFIDKVNAAPGHMRMPPADRMGVAA